MRGIKSILSRLYNEKFSLSSPSKLEKASLAGLYLGLSTTVPAVLLKDYVLLHVSDGLISLGAYGLGVSVLKRFEQYIQLPKKVKASLLGVMGLPLASIFLRDAARSTGNALFDTASNISILGFFGLASSPLIYRMYRRQASTSEKICLGSLLTAAGSILLVNIASSYHLDALYPVAAATGILAGAGMTASLYRLAKEFKSEKYEGKESNG
jgi:hypothetical protein